MHNGPGLQVVQSLSFRRWRNVDADWTRQWPAESQCATADQDAEAQSTHTNSSLADLWSTKAGMEQMKTTFGLEAFNQGTKGSKSRADEKMHGKALRWCVGLIN
ncbi:hypothetical protein RvY_15607 [Ramazzottius varieornatus]|uniref:Uncharacterized protein n=1 Tax=Ramazzottius varieornatus TaxID=947166 RepID=A0A1D1W048_RAMVA|nr:hypothetical protein RvY_15607 [Ramazzottius varieornatus]